MSVKSFARQVISRSSVSNQASNWHRISQFEPASKMSPKFEPGSNQVLGDKAPSLNPPADADARRQEMLGILAANPGTTYAIATDTDTEPDAVIVAFAIRDKTTCELRIPRSKYDPCLLLELVGRQTEEPSLAKEG